MDDSKKLVDVSEIQSELLKRHDKRVHEYELLGEKEGEMDLPGANDVLPSEYERKIRGEYSKDISYLASIGIPMLDDPHNRFRQLLIEKDKLESNITEEQSKKLTRLEEDKQRQIQLEKERCEKSLSYIEENKAIKIENAKSDNEKDMEHISIQKKKIINDFHDAEQRFRQVTDKIGRTQPIIYLKSSILEWVILVFLGFCEIPLNYTVFANFLLPNIETYILSCLLVISVPIVAHYCGICFKQFQNNKKFKHHLYVILPFMIVLNVAVSILRSDYIYEVMGTTPSIASTVTFIMLSIILLIVGIIISFLHHDRDQELVVEFNRFEKEKERYNKKIYPLQEEEKGEQNNFIKKAETILNGYEKEKKDEQDKNNSIIEKIEKSYSENRNIIDNLLPNIINQINEVVDKHDRILNTFNALEDEVNSNYVICISNYRAKNHRSRKNGLRPNSWKDPSPLDFKFHNKQELDPNVEK